MVTATLNHQLWQPTVAPGSVVPVRASEVMASGKFLHLPYIGGENVSFKVMWRILGYAHLCQLNDGTFFTPTLRNLGLSGQAEDDAFKAFINALVIDNSTLTDDVVDQLINFYPANDPDNGAPFNTGDSLFDRAAAYYTDQNFVAVRRQFFQAAASLQPMFAYHFEEFVPGNDISVGGTPLYSLYEVVIIISPFSSQSRTRQSCSCSLVHLTGLQQLITIWQQRWEISISILLLISILDVCATFLGYHRRILIYALQLRGQRIRQISRLFYNSFATM